MLTRTLARNSVQCCALLALVTIAGVAAVARADGPPYRNSVASIEFDFILESDPSAFERLEFVKQQERLMRDKRPGGAD